MGFCIIGAIVGFLPFVEYFVSKVHHEDFNTIVSLFMFTDLQIAFVMLLLCYA
jgi:hypothetical protein